MATPVGKKQNNKFPWVLYARKLRKKHIFKNLSILN